MGFIYFFDKVYYCKSSTKTLKHGKQSKNIVIQANIFKFFHFILYLLIKDKLFEAFGSLLHQVFNLLNNIALISKTINIYRSFMTV